MAMQEGSALLRLRDGLKRHFGPEAGMFVDPFLWLIGHVCVDIVRLDNWLMRRNSDYRDNESMRCFIRRKYGRNTERFVEYWLNPHFPQGRGKCALRASTLRQVQGLRCAPGACLPRACRGAQGQPSAEGNSIQDRSLDTRKEVNPERRQCEG